VSGLLVTASILFVTVAAKFDEGGYITVIITGAVIGVCMYIRNPYWETKQKIAAIDAVFTDQPYGSMTEYAELDPALPIAVFVVGTSRGGGLHALLWVQRMFPGTSRISFSSISAAATDWPPSRI
jgi:hypothetical protein